MYYYDFFLFFGYHHIPSNLTNTSKPNESKPQHDGRPLAHVNPLITWKCPSIDSLRKSIILLIDININEKRNFSSYATCSINANVDANIKVDAKSRAYWAHQSIQFCGYGYKLKLRLIIRLMLMSNMILNMRLRLGPRRRRRPRRMIVGQRQE